MDDTTLCQFHTHNENGRYETTGCGASIYLDNNQRVFVKLDRGKVHGGYYSTFTGVRIGGKN